MGLVNEFKEFAIKGNVADMAVGVIIGGAFGKIVSSLVSDVLMPPLGLLIGGVNFTGLKIPLKHEIDGTASVTLNYGNFLQSVFDFLIVAFVIFLVIKGMNKLRTKAETEKAAGPPAPSKEVLVLQEIRDLLRDSRR